MACQQQQNKGIQVWHAKTLNTNCTALAKTSWHLECCHSHRILLLHHELPQHVAVAFKMPSTYCCCNNVILSAGHLSCSKAAHHHEWDSLMDEAVQPLCVFFASHRSCHPQVVLHCSFALQTMMRYICLHAFRQVAMHAPTTSSKSAHLCTGNK